MLTRTVSKHPKRQQHHPRRRFLLGLGIFLLVSLVALLWPRSVRRVRDMAVSDDQVKERALAHLLAGEPFLTPLESKKAAIGRELFFDKSLSVDGVTSCATCHIPEKFFSDGSPRPLAGPLAGTAMVNLVPHTPALGNGRLLRWANWDGSRDSLGSQALQSLEDPSIMGSSRLHVVHRIVDSYKEAYEEAFGPLPALLRHVDLPPHGLPAAETVKLPIETASQGLATLSGRGLLLDILNQSQEKRIAPAMELSRRVLETPRPDLRWIQAYEILDDDVKSAVDHVFFKVGQALASYQRQIVSSPSRFDLFSDRLASGDTIGQAMAASSFSEQELIGFKLFVGPGKCAECHSGPGFSDQKFHNIGLSYASGPIPMGRALGALQTLGDVFNCFGGAFPSETMPTNDDSGRCPALEAIDVTDLDQVGAFKTPSLRNVTKTSPYMHDGRFSNLEQVLEVYSHFEGAPGIGMRDSLLEPLELTREEIQALTAFLNSLTSPLRDLGSESKVSLAE